MNRVSSVVLAFLLLPLLLVNSCGIPSYCTLNGVGISSSISDNSFKIRGTDTDLSKIENGPGLILCYVPAYDGQTLSNASTSSNVMISAFSKVVKTKLNIDEDLITQGVKDEGNEFSLYAFRKGNSFITGPEYHLNLSQFISESRTSIDTGDMSISIVPDSDKDFVLKYKTGEEEHELKLNAYSVSDNVERYYLFAAFSAEVGTFSNNWWSSLCYLGMIEPNK